MSMISNGKTRSTLLLNADATPISLLPISALTWQEAVSMLYVGDVEAIHHYQDWFVHSAKTTIQIPSVAILRRQISLKKRLSIGRSPNADMLFLRDGYICQYCRKAFSRNMLSMDHVLPRYHGGESNWNNLTTACKDCNHERGHDISVQPIRRPYKPSFEQLLNNIRKTIIFVPHETWTYYIANAVYPTL